MTIYPKMIVEALQTVTYAGTKRNIVESEMLADQPVVTPSLSPQGEVEKWNVEVTLLFPRETDPFLKSTVRAAEAAIRYKVNEMLRYENDTLRYESETLLDIQIKTEFRSAPRPEDDKLLPEVKNIIAVSSGKGGVGKSTVSANLAISLARLGYSVGLLDTDIFGPSVPKMFQLEDARPYAIEKDGRQLIMPVEQYGVKLLSIGFFVNKDTATLWRGGMACSALKQLIADADWGELDYLILDTPPGTSDIHLSLLQTLSITGAIIVSTPQQVALADARKGIDMYTNDKVNVPILGLVENMAWFTPERHPDEKYYIFGKEGCKQLAEEMNVPLLAQIPVVQDICENGDNGTPAALNVASPTGQAFIALAQSIVTVTNRRNAEREKTKRVTVH